MLLLATLVLLSVLCANPTTAQSDPPDMSDSTLARGRSLFLGSANCQECHGPDGMGTDLGPSLVDSAWLHGTGSYEMIVRLVTHGVTRRESTTGSPMPMRGWAPLDNDQLVAVATYVWSLSRTPEAESTAVDGL
jgi:cbb3-type cytochrome c oxidase subunit III